MSGTRQVPQVTVLAPICLKGGSALPINRQCNILGLSFGLEHHLVGTRQPVFIVFFHGYLAEDG